MAAIRKHRVQFQRDGKLHGRKVKTGEVVEVDPRVARRLIESRAAVQYIEPAKPPKAAGKEKVE